MAFINVQPDVRITCYHKPIAMVYLEHIIFDQDWFYHKSLKTISKHKRNGSGYDNPSVSFVGERARIAIAVRRVRSGLLLIAPSSSADTSLSTSRTVDGILQNYK